MNNNIQENAIKPSDLLKAQLSERLNSLCDEIGKLRQAVHNVSLINPRLNVNIDPYYLIKTSFEDWLASVCKERSVGIHNPSSEVITMRDLSMELRLGYREPEEEDDLSGHSIVYWLMHRYNFALLDEELIKLAKNIGNIGLSGAAKQLGNKFGLIPELESNEKHVVEVKKRKGRYFLEIKNNGPINDVRARSLRNLYDPISTFERTKGVLGLDEVIAAAQAKENAFGRDSMRVPLNTKVCEGKRAEGVFMKEKIRVSLEEGLFESLIQFVREHAVKGLVIKTI